jgi:hypothetical protein
MVERIKHSGYRANFDEYEDKAAGLEYFIITDDDEEIPRIALIPFEVFQQFAHAFPPRGGRLHPRERR